MSPKERRAFRLGFLSAMRRARRELDAMAQRLDDELAGLDERMRAAREQTARRLDGEIAVLVGEMQGMRNEYRRLKAIEEAVAVELDPAALLN